MSPPPATASIVEDLVQGIRAAEKPVRMFVHGAPLNALTSLAYHAQLPLSEGPARQALGWVVSLDQKTADEKTRWLGADNTLLQRLVDQGYLTSMPNIIDGSRYEVANFATPLLNDVVIASNRLGDVRELLTSKGMSNETKARLYRRWGVLLHEAAHCQSAYTANPFQPSEGALPEAAVAAINRWSVGRVAANMDMHRCMEEGFADCYGVMLLLRASDFDPEAMKVAQDTLTARRRIREEEEARWSTAAPSGRPANQLGVHYTDMALERVLANVDAWKTLPPSELAQQAFTYASDGLLELVDPKRVNDQGIPVGLSRRRLLADIKVDNLTYYGALMVGASKFTGQDIPAWQMQQLQEHPAGPVMLEAAELAGKKGSPQIPAGLQQEMPAFIGAGQSSGSTVPANAIEAQQRSWHLSSQVNNILDATRHQLMFDPFISTQIAADRALIQQALGLAPTMSDRLAARRAAAPSVEPGAATPRPSM